MCFIFPKIDSSVLAEGLQGLKSTLRDLSKVWLVALTPPCQFRYRSPYLKWSQVLWKFFEHRNIFSILGCQLVETVQNSTDISCIYGQNSEWQIPVRNVCQNGAPWHLPGKERKAEEGLSKCASLINQIFFCWWWCCPQGALVGGTCFGESSHEMNKHETKSSVKDKALHLRYKQQCNFCLFFSSFLAHTWERKKPVQPSKWIEKFKFDLKSVR